MSDTFVAPVKGILKAIDTGARIAKRVSKSARSVEHTAQALRIFECAENLQRSLTGSSHAIADTYRRYAEICGEPFARALTENKPIQIQLMELRIDLIDQTDKCEDFDNEPETFDQAAFRSIQIQSNKCCVECIEIFNGVRHQLEQANLQTFTMGDKPADDRRILTSMRPPRTDSYGTTPQSNNLLTIETSPSKLTKEHSSWSITSPSQYELDAQTTTSFGSSPRRASRDMSPFSPLDDQPRLIPKAIVDLRLRTNDEFLERRRQNRARFQKEFLKSVISVVSIDESRASPVFSDGSMITSPILGSSVLASPTDGHSSRASLNGYDSLMKRNRSQGQASQGTRSSRTSSILQDHRQFPERGVHRQDSQDSIFGFRDALSDHHSPRSDKLEPALPKSRRLAGYFSGVEDGLEVVSNLEYDNEKMVVSNDENLNHQPIPPAPPARMKSVDYPVRHDSSFYKFGGFCEGAKTSLRGEAGHSIIKRPSGQYGVILSARCIKCTYEVGWIDVEKDKLLDRSGIYGNSGVRWRQQFISKCHLRTNSVEEPLFSCIFCIEEHKTIEEHDATVFFSVPQLFRHIAKHPRPLPKVEGITTIYGHQDNSVVDFDIHFVSMEPRAPSFGLKEMSQIIEAHPTANSIITNHPKNTHGNANDPEGNPALHFAAGARIVGVTYPEQFGANWCTGYHNGERGSFPASAIMLELPPKDYVLMNAKSSLIATAKWEFKPKDARDGGWLKFNKGDKIFCIGYTFQDQWCWSGQNNKGKWGLFPAAFVEGLMDGGRLGSVASSGLGGLGRIASFGILRKSTKKFKKERSASIMSKGSLESQGESEIVFNELDSKS